MHETVAPPDTNCPCCQQPMHVIGEDTSERLDVIPAQYRVIVTHRPRLACRACERIVEAPAPEHLIKSGLPTEAMVASNGRDRAPGRPAFWLGGTKEGASNNKGRHRIRR
jgi:transposase